MNLRVAINHLIYVPGLGDSNGALQERAVLAMSRPGLEAHYVPMHWADGGPLEPKLERVIDVIDACPEDDTINLAASSAGGSVAIEAYAEHPDRVNNVVLVCPKLDRPETVEQWRFDQNPAFKTAIFGLRRAFDTLTDEQKARITSVRPLHEGVIALRDMLLPGIQDRRVISVGHAATIGLMLTARRRTLIKLATAEH